MWIHDSSYTPFIYFTSRKAYEMYNWTSTGRNPSPLVGLGRTREERVQLHTAGLRDVLTAYILTLIY
jgi:hypothetical protein